MDDNRGDHSTHGAEKHTERQAADNPNDELFFTQMSACGS
jgi:hypothetical protein